MNAELTDDSRAIQISAETTDIRVAPGSSIEVSVKIYNNSASAGNYQIFIEHPSTLQASDTPLHETTLVCNAAASGLLRNPFLGAKLEAVISI